MAKEIKMPLPSAADLFSTQEERDNAGRESVRDIHWKKSAISPITHLR